MRLFFFFQAEDGIRDDLVTGVQTCALPISEIKRYRSGDAPVDFKIADWIVIMSEQDKQNGLRDRKSVV